MEKGTGRRIFPRAFSPLPTNYGIEGEGLSWIRRLYAALVRTVDVLSVVVEPGAA
jgi:hypothetical protein